MLLTGILTPERIICKGEALSRIKQADSSQPQHSSQPLPSWKSDCALHCLPFFILAIFSPWIFDASLLCEPAYALPTNPFAAQVNKCWVLLFAANHKHGVCVPPWHCYPMTQFLKSGRTGVPKSYFWKHGLRITL